MVGFTEDFGHKVILIGNKRITTFDVVIIRLSGFIEVIKIKKMVE